MFFTVILYTHLSLTKISPVTKKTHLIHIQTGWETYTYKFNFCFLRNSKPSLHWYTSFWFALLRSYNTKCKHSLCWWSQNTRGCTSTLWLRNDQHYISCTFDHDNLHHSCIIVQVNVLWLIYLDHIMAKSPVCVNNISWVLNLHWQVLPFYVPPNSGQQIWAVILVWFVSTTDHSTRLMYTIWKIFLIHLYCPTAESCTSQLVLQ